MALPLRPTPAPAVPSSALPPTPSPRTSELGPPATLLIHEEDAEPPFIPVSQPRGKGKGKGKGKGHCRSPGDSASPPSAPSPAPPPVPPTGPSDLAVVLLGDPNTAYSGGEWGADIPPPQPEPSREHSRSETVAAVLRMSAEVEQDNRLSLEEKREITEDALAALGDSRRYNIVSSLDLPDCDALLNAYQVEAAATGVDLGIVIKNAEHG